jgi:hypothetical protein
MKRLLRLLVSLLLFVAPLLHAQTIEVDPARCVIVLPAGATPVAATAAQELRKHLALVTQREIPIVEESAVRAGAYPDRGGLAFPEETKPLAPEEARWRVTPAATYLYGDASTPASLGVQYAVYDFLEEELGLRWIEPTDQGIAFTPQSPLKLTVAAHAWAPELLLRKLRTSWRPGQPSVVRDYVKNFADFIRTPAEHERYAEEVALWQKRMRMGGREAPAYGHGFTNWWKKYGATHPDYFALRENGKREPELIGSAKAIHTADNPKGFQNIKLCPSNPALAAQIVQDWVAAGRRSKWINVCENDVPPVNYCVCPECQKLDVPAPREAPMEHLTDRYVHLANAVVREARKIDPAAGAIMYAYDRQLLPPRREKLEPTVAVALVPTTTDPAQLEELYGGWEKAGAKLLMLRPNYHTYFNTLAIPAGFEEHMFQAFQVAYRHGARGADYDSLVGHWPVTGLSDYVLARALSDPGQPFQHWVDHYCAAYGAAAGEVARYFAYWRQEVWNKRLQPDLHKIVEKGRYYNFARGLTWSLGDYYRLEDFDRTDAILQQAARATLTASERQKLDVLILANQHARLTFNAITGKGQEQFAAARTLLDFRRAQKNRLPLNWIGLFATESRFGDVTGIGKSYELREYPLPWVDTGVTWRFRMDPENAGLAQKWHELPWEATANWDSLRVDAAWENAYDSETDPKLAARLKNYDGIAWYTTRVPLPKEMAGHRVFVFFGGVDESCWLYVNGHEAGAHVYKNGDPMVPFPLEITPQVDWTQPLQTLTVRVEDKGGLGGLTSRIWVVSKSASDEKK